MKLKSFELFRGVYDYGSTILRNGFYPSALNGQSSPPVNIVPTGTGEDLTPKKSMEISAVWACVWLIANTVASMPFAVKRLDDTGVGKDDTLNPLYTVLSLAPNLNMDAMTYWVYMIASQMLWGNAYSLRETSSGQTVMLSTLLPQFVLPVVEKGKLLYRYYPGGSAEPIAEYTQEQIFHVRDNTLDGLVGLSRIEFARRTFGIASAADGASADIYRNGLRSNGFLSADTKLKKEQRDMIREDLQRFRRGGPDAAGFMVLEAGLKFSALNMPPQDAQLIESRKFSVPEICRFFNVPPVLVGDTGVSTWGTGIEQLLGGWKTVCIRPQVRKLEMAVQTQLVPLKDRSTVYLEVDVEDMNAMDSTAQSNQESTDAQNGIRTRNEIRKKRGLAPIEGGDELTVQVNLTPLNKLGKTPPAQTNPAANPAPPSKNSLRLVNSGDA